MYYRYFTPYCFDKKDPREYTPVLCTVQFFGTISESGEHSQRNDKVWGAFWSTLKLLALPTTESGQAQVYLTTAPCTTNGYAMHGRTETSIALLTAIDNIVSKIKTGTEYTLLPTKFTTYTPHYNGCTTHGPSKTSTPFFRPYTGTHHIIRYTALPQHQMRA